MGGAAGVAAQVTCFGLSLVKLDIRQESDRHADVMDAITTYLGLGSYKAWPEQQKIDWLVRPPLIFPLYFCFFGVSVRRDSAAEGRLAVSALFFCFFG